MSTFDIVRRISDKQHLLGSKALVMHEEEARKSNACQLLTLFADLAKNAMVKGKILIQTIIGELFLGSGASAAGEQAVLLFAARMSEISQCFFHIFQHTALVQRQLLRQLHMIAN